MLTYSQPDNVKLELEKILDMNKLKRHVARIKHEVQCFQDAASNFYCRPDRMQWPDECTPEKVFSVGMLTEQVCVGPTFYSSGNELNSINKVTGAFVGICIAVEISKQCKQVFDGKRTQELLKIER